jgi:RimJ/RimL family protein N-acetyltransferase
MPLARCTHDDIPQICAIEQRAENQGRIGAWTPETHIAHMAAPHVAYFARRDAGGALAAYAIVDRIIDPDGRAYLRRIATQARGGGHGRALLIEVLTFLFTETDAQSIELLVRDFNENARALYADLGFREDGVLHTRDGFTTLVMSLTRDEWRARCSAG